MYKAIGKRIWVLLVLLAVGLILFLRIWDFLFFSTETVKFRSSENETISCTYYSGNYDGGVLLIGDPDGSINRIHHVATMLAKSGLKVFCYIPSAGVLGLADSNTAMEKNLSNINDISLYFQAYGNFSADKLVICAYGSYANNMLLRLAADGEPSAGYIFAGADFSEDDTALLDTLKLTPPSVPVSIVVGTDEWERVRSSSVLLYNTLTGASLSQVATAENTDRTVTMSAVEGITTPYKNYVSDYLVCLAKSATHMVGSHTPADLGGDLLLNVSVWFAAGVALFLALLLSPFAFGGNLAFEKTPKIVSFPRFFISKLVLWAPAVLLMLLFGWLYSVLPMEKPQIASLAVFGILSYAIMSLLMYRIIKSTIYGFAKPIHIMAADSRHIQYLPLSFIYIIITVVLLGIWANIGWNSLLISTSKLLWLLIISAATFIGYLCVYEDMVILTTNGVNLAKKLLIFLVLLLPFFVLPFYHNVMGNTADTHLAIQSLVIVLMGYSFGFTVYKLSRQPFIGALFGTLLTQLLNIAEAVIG